MICTHCIGDLGDSEDYGQYVMVIYYCNATGPLIIQTLATLVEIIPYHTKQLIT